MDAAVTEAKLSTYRAKRNFAQTAEPSGATPVAPGPALRFVIQKHAATPPALRPSPGARRHFQILGRDARPLARPARQAACRRGRRSSARLRGFRRHDPERPIWRWHRHAVGPRHLDPRATLPAGSARIGGSQVHASRREAARLLGPGADETRPERRQAHQLVADQACRPERARRRG